MQFSKEYWARKAKGEKGLSEGAYAYLKDAHGVPREVIDHIQEAMEALTEKLQGGYVTAAGGKEAFDTALAWANKGGYTRSMRMGLQAALNAGGQAASDAGELLAKRHAAATGKERRPSTPSRDATKGAATGAAAGGVKPFATADDYHDARRAAQASGKQEEVEVVRARLRASDWYAGNKRNKTQRR
jgi:hypothetical protein